MRAPLLWRSIIGIVGLINFGSFNALAQTTDGIYADFNTTLGNFTVTLDFTNAPKTVANFIGLATGQRAWMDWNTGQVRTNPFYNNLTFHRVVSNFVIQAGSPNGQGTDGPGYVLMDEISSALRHSKTGVIAMAKSSSSITGEVLPHTASSQFYITLATNANTAGLDGSYAVFGQVSSGLDKVLAIGRVNTDTNSKPLTNVVINSVSIRRVGTTAQNFNIQTQPLPAIQKVAAQITHSNQQVTLKLSNNFAYAQTRVFASTNLRQWTVDDLGVELLSPFKTNIVQAATNRTGFYNLTRVQYPSSTRAPRNLYGKALTLVFGDGSGTGTIVCDQSGGGFYTDGSGGENSLSYTWFQDIYRGYFYPLEAWNTFYLQLDFTSDTAGSFSGVVYLGIWWPTYGTFSLAPTLVPGAVNLITPAESAIITTPQPQFVWSQANPAATWYNLVLYRNGSNFLSQWSQTTNCVSSNALPTGSYSWYVRGWNSSGDGFFSSVRHFTVPPGVITPISPTGTNTVGPKDYTWVADPYATWYELLVFKNGAQFLDQWYATGSLTPVNPNRLSARVSTSHTTGNYSWWVRALGARGTNEWSATMSFTIP